MPPINGTRRLWPQFEAEEMFEQIVEGGTWPAGTNGYVYERDEPDRAIVPKSLCSQPDSPAVIACSDWLPRLGITIVT